MVAKLLRATALTALVSYVLAASNAPTCGPGTLCPESSPCCSAYGQCGVGAYCDNGCDPRYSHSLKSCLPSYTCKTKDYQLKSLDDVADISKYLGDNSKTNWVSSGKPVVYNDNSILLTMAPDTVGTLVSSTNYIWYGKVSATLTTSQGAGVVTAFILMSDSKDEIDFEFVGTDVQHVQSNYYSQGITNYNNEVNLTASNTQTDVHTYTIDWSPDKIDWIVDGKVLRTKNRADTWNSTSGRWDFPQTPARVMLSLWPAGLPSNGQGTIDWAGGLVDWNSPYMKNGYYYAAFSDVNVQCYDPPQGAHVQGSKTYVYTDTKATNQSIEISDNIVVMKSLYASGENPDYNPDGTSGSQPSNTPETVPGVSGVGTRGDNPNGGSGSGNSSSSGGFSQGTTGSKSGAGESLSLRGTGGSVFAVLVAFVLGCIWL